MREVLVLMAENERREKERAQVDFFAGDNFVSPPQRVKARQQGLDRGALDVGGAGRMVGGPVQGVEGHVRGEHAIVQGMGAPAHRVDRRAQRVDASARRMRIGVRSVGSAVCCVDGRRHGAGGRRQLVQSGARALDGAGHEAGGARTALAR